MPNEMVKCKATIYFYNDPKEKPEVILEGSWVGRDIVRTAGLLRKAYRIRIRDLQREGKLTLEEAKVKEDETKEELEDEVESTDPETTIVEGKE